MSVVPVYEMLAAVHPDHLRLPFDTQNSVLCGTVGEDDGGVALPQLGNADVGTDVNVAEELQGEEHEQEEEEYDADVQW